MAIKLDAFAMGLGAFALELVAFALKFIMAIKTPMIFAMEETEEGD